MIHDGHILLALVALWGVAMPLFGLIGVASASARTRRCLAVALYGGACLSALYGGTLLIDWKTGWDGAWALFAAAALLGGLALRLLEDRPLSIDLIDVALALGITIAAVALRVSVVDWAIGPYHQGWMDERRVGWAAGKFLDGDRHHMWNYVHTKLLAAAGLALWERSYEGLRLPFAIFSGLATLPLYALGRMMGGRLVAVSVALLWTVSYWSLTYSQIACTGYAPIVATVALLAWIGSPWTLPLLGFFAALLWCEYEVVRPMLLLPVVAWIGTPSWLGRILAAIVVVAMLVGWANHMAQGDRWRVGFMDAARRASESDGGLTIEQRVEKKLSQLRRASLMMVRGGESHLPQGLPGRSILPPVALVLFALGVVVSAWRWPSLLAVIVAMWIGATMAVGELFSHRFEPMQAAVYACVALGMTVFRRALGPWVFAAVMVVAVGYEAHVARGYLSRYWTDPAVEYAQYYELAHVVIQLCADVPPGTRFVFVAKRYGNAADSTSDARWLCDPPLRGIYVREIEQAPVGLPVWKLDGGVVDRIR